MASVALTHSEADHRLAKSSQQSCTEYQSDTHAAQWPTPQSSKTNEQETTKIKQCFNAMQRPAES